MIVIAFSVHFDVTISGAKISGATMFIDGGDVVIFCIREGLTVSGFSVVLLGMGEGFDGTAVVVVSFGKEEGDTADVVTDAVEVGGAEVVFLVHFP